MLFKSVDLYINYSNLLSHHLAYNNILMDSVVPQVFIRKASKSEDEEENNKERSLNNSSSNLISN